MRTLNVRYDGQTFCSHFPSMEIFEEIPKGILICWSPTSAITSLTETMKEAQQADEIPWPRKSHCD